MNVDATETQGPANDIRTLTDLRTTLLNWLLRTAALLGAPMLAIGLFDELHSHQRIGAIVAYVASYSVLLIAAVWQRLGRNLRGALFLLALYTVGTTSLQVTGLSSPTSLYLFAFVIFSGLLFGLGIGLVAFTVSTLTLALVGGLCVSGLWIIGTLSTTYISVWITFWVSFVCVSAAALVSLTLLLRGLERSIQASRALTDDLRKAAQERARAERGLLLKDVVFSTSLSANSITDLQGIITDVNAAFLLLSGCPTKEDALGKPISSFVSDIVDAKGIARILDATGEWEGDFTAKRADGSLFMAHALATSLKDETGATVAYQSSVLDITARKRTEDALRQSERQARTILEQQHQLCAMLTADGFLVEVNRTALEFARVQKSDVLGRPFWDTPWWTHSSLQQQRLKAAIADVRSGGTAEFDTTHIGPDGCEHYLEFSLRPVFDEHGAVNLMIAEGHDITDRKKAEEALRESETKYRRLIETTSTGYVILDDTGRVIDANSEYVHLTGHQRLEQIVGRRVTEWTAPHDIERNAHEVEKCIAFGAVVGLDVDYLHADGTVIPVEINASTLQTDTGLMIVTLCRDITERKRAEAERRRNEARLRILVDILQYPATTTQELLDYALDRAIDLTESTIGYLYFYHDDRKEFVLNSWSKEVMRECSIVDPHTCYELNKTGLWGEAVRQHKPIIVNNFEADHPLKKGYPEGHAQLYKFMTTPVFSGGQVVAVIGLANKATNYTETDVLQVTVLLDSVWKMVERKRSEEEKESLQAQLLQSKKIESVGRLAGGVAHDFNNMLSVILGHTELALDALEPEHPLFVDLQEIHRAAQRSAGLTRQLLAFARKQAVTPKVLDLNETVDGMLKMLTRLIGEDILLEWKPGQDVWPIWMDPTQIDQILANLCVNARDAISGSGKITITTANATLDEAYCARHVAVSPGDYTLLSVNDTGCGMDREVLEHVFEPFFTTKGIGTGTGLGLATVHGIVKQNSGLIDVFSRSGQGTTFRIYLPRHLASPGTSRETSREVAAMEGKETILLVEDEQAILKLTQRYLAQLGYQVLSANSPEQALQLAETYAGRIHILITDVVMPEMNGQQLKEHLLARYPDILCLFMSGYTAEVIALHGVLDQGINFIQKPFSMHDLSRRIRDVLDAPPLAQKPTTNAHN